MGVTTGTELRLGPRQVYRPRGVSRLGPFTPRDTGVERGERQEGHPDSSLRHVRARRSQGTDRAATPLGLCRAPAPHPEPTPRRPGLGVRAWGEVRAGPRWVGVAGSRSCCHSAFQAAQLGRRRSPREPGCARPRGRTPTSLRSRAPARSALPSCAHPCSPSFPPAPPSSLPLSSPLPFILTLLGRPLKLHPGQSGLRR